MHGRDQVCIRTNPDKKKKDLRQSNTLRYELQKSYKMGGRFDQQRRAATFEKDQSVGSIQKSKKR